MGIDYGNFLIFNEGFRVSPKFFYFAYCVRACPLCVREGTLGKSTDTYRDTQKRQRERETDRDTHTQGQGQRHRRGTDTRKEMNPETETHKNRGNVLEIRPSLKRMESVTLARMLPTSVIGCCCSATVAVGLEQEARGVSYRVCQCQGIIEEVPGTW